MAGSRSDLKVTLRGLRRSPGVLLAVVVSLALGIGANANLLAVLDRLLLRPPEGVREAGSLVRLYFSDSGAPPQSEVAYPIYTDLRGKVPAFSALAAYCPFDGTLGRGREAQKARMTLVTPSFFSLLGVAPARGRLFSPEEGDPKRPARVALLSFEIWQRSFGGDPGVIGRPLPVGGQVVTVVGIVPPRFTGVDLEPVDVWLPFGAFDPGWLARGWPDDRSSFFLNLIGRLRPGASQSVATQEATALHRQVYAALGERQAATRAVTLGPVQPGFSPEKRAETRLAAGLAGTAFLVLLIACANVANLLLVRGVERRRELALRAVLGASRRRLTRLLLTESLFLALLGGLAAWGVASACSPLLRAFLFPDGVPFPGGVDLRLVTLLVASSLAAGLVTGLVPVLWGSRQGLAAVLPAEAYGDGRGRSRFRTGLLVAQVAFTFVLLVGAGLFGQSLRKVGRLPLGLVPERLLLATGDLGSAGYGSREVDALYRTALERVRRLPGVKHASLAAGIPFRSSFATNLWVPGYGEVTSDIAAGGLYYNAVSADFLATLGIALRRGRALTAQDDRLGAERVAVVNESMARVLWPKVDPLGRCFQLLSQTEPCITVVGVAEDSRRNPLEAAPTLQFYLPLAQAPRLSPGALFARTAGDPLRQAEAVRRTVQDVAPNLPFVDVRPFAGFLEPTLRPFHAGAALFAFFGLLALVLAVAGIAGTVAHAVASQIRNLGIRMALGATPRTLLVELLRGSLGRTTLGIALGLALARLGGRFLAPLLFETRADDPAVLATAALILMTAALLASAMPGWRIGRIDPAAAMRGD